MEKGRVGEEETARPQDISSRTPHAAYRTPFWLVAQPSFAPFDKLRVAGEGKACQPFSSLRLASSIQHPAPLSHVEID